MMFARSLLAVAGVLAAAPTLGAAAAYPRRDHYEITAAAEPPTPTLVAKQASGTSPTTTITATAASSPGLNDAAKATGKLWFGTAADIPGTDELTDSYYMAEFNNTRDFGGATPANVMKFQQTEPEQGVFDFSDAEQFMSIAKATGKLVRCHNLIWSQELPSWVTSPSTPWTNATLSAVLQNHVTSLINHFGNACYSWDVVNEALADSPLGSYTSNPWLTYIGEDYVPMAFAAATQAVRAGNLTVKLYYNDYNIEYAGAKADAAMAIVQDIKARGYQIDGVGMESHFIVGSTPDAASQTAVKQNFTALDVDVAITELDVRANTPPTAADETQQVVDYYNSVASCAAVARCVGVTVWDFVDTYSWVPSTFAGTGYADLFLQPGGSGTPLVKKAAYDGVLEALLGEPEAN
ncbi:glycoside hydrolase superfamily [Xylariaceae sp. FL0804]|nr:glycoside hydrolase superfamily [Xylariaceae sp. FL0804]